MVPRRVLVVDDNIDSANSIAMLLSHAGHEVKVAHDGLKALELARSARPEFVFLDLGLPKLDGFEVARALRREPALAGVRIIAVTGYGQESDRAKAIEAGIDQHIVKPADPAFIESLLGARR
ncbi:MAG TPA: response regulator [Burkholderiales bacterium]|nr:response regulator [Burkholderiales bacterium]